MSALSDFVNEQRNKSGSSNGGIRPSFSSLTNMGMRPSFSMANIGTKIGTSFNGFFKTDGSDDLEALTDNPAQNGQLPSTRNRRPGATTGWFSFGADEAVCGLTRFQRISAFFLFMFAAAFCFASALMILPMLVLQTRKFAALNTLGSTFFIMSFGFLWVH
uniref:Vesicle transport protein n=1 Tax=Ditylenchus dipsaci TaxID=166011 RepID=A0A915DGJ3_9BILA